MVDCLVWEFEWCVACVPNILACACCFHHRLVAFQLSYLLLYSRNIFRSDLSYPWGDFSNETFSLFYLSFHHRDLHSLIVSHLCLDFVPQLLLGFSTSSFVSQDQRFLFWSQTFSIELTLFLDFLLIFPIGNLLLTLLQVFFRTLRFAAPFLFRGYFLNHLWIILNVDIDLLVDGNHLYVGLKNGLWQES